MKYCTNMLSIFIIGTFLFVDVFGNAVDIDSDGIAAAINDLQDHEDLEGFKDIKRPDDIPQIKDWKNRCREEHGVEKLKEIEAAPAEMLTCVLQFVNIDKLQVEVNRSMARGNLDLVFKKYCGYREGIMSCVNRMLDTFKPCMSPQQLVDVNVTRRVADAAIDFTCHDDGDRIALFMAEEGVECVREHKDTIRACIEERVPSVKATLTDPDSLGLDDLVFNEEQCDKLNAMHQCIVQETTKCSDPTPANILDSLIAQMLKVTPCWGFNTRKAQQQTDAAEDVSSGANSLSNLLRNSIASIGPFLTSGFYNIGIVSSLLGALCLVISQIHAVILAGVTVFTDFLSSIIELVSSAVSFIAIGLSSVWYSMYGFLQGNPSSYSDALKKDGFLKGHLLDLQNMIGLYFGASVKTSVERLCMLLYAQLSLSVVLVVMLAAVTAAHLLL